MVTDVVTVRLAECERVIERGLNTFVEVGAALLEIRDSRLYKDGHYNTFEEYCYLRWGLKQSQAYRLMDAADVVGNLKSSPIGELLPLNEAQARPLVGLSPELQTQVWQQVVDTAPEGKITGAHVQKLVDNLKECQKCGKLWMADLPFCPYCNLSVDARIEGMKKNAHVSYNSGVNEWYTPPEYIRAARKVMGRIDIDPASSEIANRTVEAYRYYSVENDGLSQIWAGKVWLNPPYASELIVQFVAKYVEAVSSGDVSEGIVLVNNATETNWFNELARVSSAVVFPKGRVKFLDPDGNPGAPLQGQAILYAGGFPSVFLNEFSGFGWGAEIC